MRIWRVVAIAFVLAGCSGELSSPLPPGEWLDDKNAPGLRRALDDSFSLSPPNHARRGQIATPMKLSPGG